MMRWIPVVVGLALIFSLVPGCERHTLLAEGDAGGAVSQLAGQLERDPTAGVTPMSGSVAAPPIVDYPDRTARYMTLSEAIAIALENGTASGTGPGGAGAGNVADDLAAFSRGPFASQTDKIRVLALNPAITGTNIEASESRFDAKWITSTQLTTQNNFLNGFLTTFNNGNFVTMNSSIVKELATGGVVNATIGNANPSAFNAFYTNLSAPPAGVINNFYSVPVSLGIEQPLWRDFGVGINQLLNQVAPITGVTMPGPAAAYFNNSRLPLSQGPNFNGLAVPGILLARLQFDQARAEFERQVHILLVNTEVAYWNLYKAYGQLYSFEEVLRLSHKAWVIGQANFAQGRLKSSDFYPIRAQYEEFRGERMRALGAVLEAERNLRGIVGLPVEDGTRVVPITPPALSPFLPNWRSALDDALALRPELVLARENLKNAQFTLIIQKNFLKPDLRAVAQYQPVGFGTSLAGPGTIVDGNGNTRPANALRSLASDQFNNYFVGLTLNVPLGYRLENAAVRSARLQLAQSYYFLQDQEQRAERALTQQYQKINEWYRRIETSRAERQAYAESVKSYFKLVEAGTKTPGDLALLDYQRRMALAQTKEYEAIGEYNSSLARFEFAKGTIMNHDNVSVAEGALPELIQVRAIDEERRRSRALVLRERERPTATPLMQPGLLAGDANDVPRNLEDAPPAAPLGPMPRLLDDAAPAAPGVNPEKSKGPKISDSSPTLPEIKELPGTAPENANPSSAPTSGLGIIPDDKAAVPSPMGPLPGDIQTPGAGSPPVTIPGDVKSSSPSGPPPLDLVPPGPTLPFLDLNAPSNLPPALPEGSKQ